MQNIDDYLQDIADVLEQEGVDMAAYYNSGRLSDTEYYKIADSLVALHNKLSEVKAADPKHGEQIYIGGYPLLYVAGAGLYFLYERETLPIRESVLEEIAAIKTVRLAYTPNGVDIDVSTMGIG